MKSKLPVTIVVTAALITGFFVGFSLLPSSIRPMCPIALIQFSLPMMPRPPLKSEIPLGHLFRIPLRSFAKYAVRTDVRNKYPPTGDQQIRTPRQCRGSICGGIAGSSHG